MANKRIGYSPVKMRAISLEDTDWFHLNRLKKEYGLGSVSSLLRLFIRLIEEEPYVLRPLIFKLVKKNTRIQSNSKEVDVLESLLEKIKQAQEIENAENTEYNLS